MAFFQRLTPQEMREHFVYTGRFAGVVPVLIGALDGDDGDGMPTIATDNGTPEWCLDLFLRLFDAYAWCLDVLDIEAPGYPLYITARLDGSSLDDDPEFRSLYDDDDEGYP